MKNVLEHAFIVGEGPVLDLSDLTPELRGEPPLGEPLVAESSKELGVSRSTLWRKL